MEYKLGKLPPRIDTRTLKLSTILRLPVLPDTYDVDSKYPDLTDNNVYLNDTLGDCVIAARAHMTLRLERFEQGIVIPITDTEVRAEYIKETGGPDSGLNMLDSLNQWRQKGWIAAGKLYKIHAFASINWKNHTEVMAGAYLFNGVYFGMQVPQSAFDQHNRGEVWSVIPNDGGIQGGHAVYDVAYNPLADNKLRMIKLVAVNEVGPVCITWGTRQAMTWEFWDKYVDEAYIIIDERDSWVPSDTDPLDIALLQQYLSDIGTTPSTQVTVGTLSLPVGRVNKPYSGKLNADGGEPPYTWTLYSGTLPEGLTLNSNGMVTGYPSTAGSFTNIAFFVKDSVGNATGIILTIQIKKKCIFE